jgi:hypothetical protein
LKELGLKNLRECRSAPKTTDLWIKTTKNSTNPKIKFRAIFWDIFRKKLGAKLEGMGVKSVETFALIPYDMRG